MKQLTRTLCTAMCFTGLAFSDLHSGDHSLQTSGHSVDDGVSRAVVIDGGSRVLGWPDGTAAIEACATAIDSW